MVVAAVGAAILFVVAMLARRLKSRRGVRIVASDGGPTILPTAKLSDRSSELGPSSMRTLNVAGERRRFLVRAPRETSAAPLPLVLVFHGDGWTAPRFHEAFSFERASGSGAVLVYPEGIGETWRLGDVTPNPDVLFVEAMLAEGTLPRFDRSRVFLVGYSSGGFFANVFACQRSTTIRAISSSAGGAPYDQEETWPNRFPKCPRQAPVATLVLHGEHDFSVGLDSGAFTATYWGYVNGCDPVEREGTGYPECLAHRGCLPGKSVVFCSIPALGHWMWSSAAEASWAFFSNLHAP